VTGTTSSELEDAISSNKSSSSNMFGASWLRRKRILRDPTLKFRNNSTKIHKRAQPTES
jgi:hypothetical protein